MAFLDKQRIRLVNIRTDWRYVISKGRRLHGIMVKQLNPLHARL